GAGFRGCDEGDGALGSRSDGVGPPDHLPPKRPVSSAKPTPFAEPLPQVLSRPGELVFLPLGGAGEIGMNLNLYGYGGRWLMVDLGVTFGGERTPGIEVIMPEISFIEERRRDLLGLLLTHRHQDHIRALPYLWPRPRCPIYP